MKLKFTPGQCAERIRLFSSNRVLRAIMSCAVVYFAVDSTDVNATEEGKNKLHVSGSSNSGPTAKLSKKAQKKQRQKEQEVRRLDPDEQKALQAYEQLNRFALEKQLEQRREGGHREETSVHVSSHVYREESNRVEEETESRQAVLSEVEVETESRQVVLSEVEVETESRQVVLSEVEVETESRQAVLSEVEVETESRQAVLSDVEVETESRQAVLSDVEVETESRQAVLSDVEVEPEFRQAVLSDVEVEPESRQAVLSDVEVEPESRQAVLSDVEVEPEPQQAVPSDVEEEPAQQESTAIDSKPREAVALIDDKPSPDDRLREMIASYSLLEGNVLHSAERMSEDGTIVVGEGFINGRAQPFIARDDEGKIGIVGLLDLNDSLNNATLYSSVLQSAVQTFVQDSMRCSNFDQYGVCISAGALYSHNAGKVNGANWQGEFSAAYRINDDWIAGLGYQAPSYRFDVSNDTMRNRASLFGLFAEYGTRTRPGVFARVALGYQQGDLSIDRSYLTASGVDRSKGDTTVAQRAVSTQGGYVFAVRNASIMPYLGIDYLRTKLGDYTETSGQFPVRFSARTDGNVYGTVGLSSHLRFTDQTVISAGVKHVQRLSKSNDPVSASVSAFDPFVVGAESTRQWSEISVGGRFATPVKASSLDIGYRRRFASGAAVAQDMGSVFFTMGF
jgi:uncharacterized protein YhjY with autotransporter beta-barrel domain